MSLVNLGAYIENNEATSPRKGYRGLNLFGYIRFTIILVWGYTKVIAFHYRALFRKECYIGPFLGEFGNFLLHILPYISYLHNKGVKVHFCGLALHKPFLVDEDGKRITYSDTLLRDFFKDVKPSGNSMAWLPIDVLKKIEEFEYLGKKKGIPFLNLSDNNLYWFVFRNWQLSNKQQIYDLSKVYGLGARQSKCVIFPRKMSTDFTPNNGGRVNYHYLAEKLLLVFEEVVFIGHPEFSDVEISAETSAKYRFSVSGSNYDVLKECSTAQVIISQHSGAIHVGAYTKTPVCMIFNGTPPIQGLDDTIRFRKNFKFSKVQLGFSEDEVVNIIRSKILE